MNTEATVMNHIVENLLPNGNTDKVSPDESLLDSGLLDSASIFQLVLFLETKFGLEIPDEEIVPDNFESIEKIVRFVEEKRGASP